MPTKQTNEFCDELAKHGITWTKPSLAASAVHFNIDGTPCIAYPSTYFDGGLRVQRDFHSPHDAISSLLGKHPPHTAKIVDYIWHDHGGDDCDTHEFKLSCGHSLEWLSENPPLRCPTCGANVLAN